MKIKLNSVFVQDQERALRFYSEVLGFIKKMDIPAGEFRWLTVVSSEEPEGAQLLLEPNDNPAAATYQKALFESGGGGKAGPETRPWFIGQASRSSPRRTKIHPPRLEYLPRGRTGQGAVA